MNTETGQIYDRKAMGAEEFERAVKDAEARGQAVVPVSEKVARDQRADQVAMSRAQRRVKLRGRNNRKRR